MRKQCVPGVLSPLPSERLGTRLTHIYMYRDPVLNHQIKIRQHLCNGHLGPNRQINFSSRQYFRLYSM